MLPLFTLRSECPTNFLKVLKQLSQLGDQRRPGVPLFRSGYLDWEMNMDLERLCFEAFRCSYLDREINADTEIGAQH